jgi:hypothetical protein
MKLLNNITNLILEISLKKQYMISGAIEGCLDVPYEKLNMGLYRVEVYKNDPWIAMLSTKQPINKNQLNEFDKHYVLDPDKKNIPYYYVINDQYIKFTNSSKWFTKKEAKIYGAKNGLKNEHLDF